MHINFFYNLYNVQIQKKKHSKLIYVLLLSAVLSPMYIPYDDTLKRERERVIPKWMAASSTVFTILTRYSRISQVMPSEWCCDGEISPQ